MEGFASRRAVGNGEKKGAVCVTVSPPEAPRDEDVPEADHEHGFIPHV
jgi:hypothetical protein